MLDRRDHQPPARHRARPARDHQGIGLRTTGGQQHLVRIHPQSACQARTSLSQQRPHPPARSVLRARIRPAPKATGQILSDLPGDLGADGAGGGVIEIGAHAPRLFLSPDKPDFVRMGDFDAAFSCGTYTETL